jgi:hypothetical protein
MPTHKPMSMTPKRQMTTSRSKQEPNMNERESTRLSEYPARKAMLARSIGERFCETPQLKPIDVPGFFGAGFMDIQNVYDEKLSMIAWTLVANHLEAESKKRIIDHPWLVAFDGPPFEPWGFVSEPYLDDNEELRASLNRLSRSGNFLQVQVLTKEQSAWNPGACLPIAVLIRNGELRPFVHWALLQIRNAL